MSNNDSITCVAQIKVFNKQDWKGPISAIEFVKKKQEDKSNTKYEFKTLDCKTAGKKYFYKVKKVTTVLTDEQKQQKAEDCGHSNWVDYKNSGWKCDGPTPVVDPIVITPGGRYRDCTGGSYSKGCMDTEGIIKKVQGCLGTTVDGKFWSNTESALMSKTGKNTFTKEDVSKICSGVSTDGGPLKPFGIEEQKIYWEDLKSEGQITTLGTPLTSTKNNVVVYVYKKNRTTDRKEKITSNEVNWKSSPEIKDDLLKSFEVYDYIVLHPINPNTPNIPGEVSIMTAGLNQDDEVVISTVTAGRWAPAQKTVSYDSEESNDLMEETIQKILKGRLIEQNVTLTKHSSPDPTIKGTDIASTSTKGGGTGTSTTTTKSTTTPKTIDVKVETEKVMTPIKQKALNKIQEWDDYNEGLSGLSIRSAGKGKINTEIDKARSIIQSVEPKDFCSNNVKSQINSAMTDINKKKKEYSSILTNQDNKFMSELEALLNDLIVGCETIQTKVKSSAMSTTVGGTSVDGIKPESTSVSGPKPESTATSELKKEEESIPDCSNSVTMLVDYLISGLQDVTTDQTKIDKQKSDLCYCHRTGGFNSMNARTKVGDIFKDKIKSYDLKSDFKTKVAPDKQLFRPLINRNLGWNEIQKLIQGKPIFKVTINSQYIDRNFGTENCYRAVNESINSKVKRHMTEAIKTKRKDVMVESILKDIKGLRK